MENNAAHWEDAVEGATAPDNDAYVQCLFIHVYTTCTLYYTSLMLNDI